MIAKRKIKAIARQMFKASLERKHLDTGKVRNILQKFTREKPHGYLQILKAYKRLVQIQAAREEVVVETATQLDKNLEKEIMAKTKAQKIKYTVNKALVFGAKITHGDWIYDASLGARLEQLKTE